MRRTAAVAWVHTYQAATSQGVGRGAAVAHDGGVLMFKVVKSCSGDLYETIPHENMDVLLGNAETALENAGFKLVANVQRFLIADSPEGIRFELHTTGRIEVRTPEKRIAETLAREVYDILGETL